MKIRINKLRSTIRRIIKESIDGRPEYMPQHFQGGPGPQRETQYCSEKDVINVIERILSTQGKTSIWQCGVDDYTDLADWIGRMKSKECSAGTVQDAESVAPELFGELP